MNSRIEQRNDGVFGRNGIRHEDVATGGVQEPAEPFGNHRLAVFRRTVDENRFPAADGQAEFVEQIGERCAQRFGTAGRADHRLPATLLDVGLQRHWCRSDVAALFKGFAGAAASEFGQVETVRSRPDQVARGDVEAFFILEQTQGLFDDLKRKSSVPRNLNSDQVPLQVELLQHQVADLHQGQPSRFKSRRSGGAQRRRRPPPFHF